MNKTIITIIVIVLIVMAAAVWFNSSSPSAVPYVPDMSTDVSAPSASAATGTEAAAADTAPRTKKFVITGSNFSFSPAIITVNKGDHVKITLKNADGFHDLKIDEFGVGTKRIKAGEEDSFEFTADTVGSFEYYCSVGSHRAMGMKGTLVVQ